MEDCKDRDILTVTTTVASIDDGQALARAILAARLAACVQLEQGLTSFYRWDGRDCEEAEVRLTIKTVPACLEPLQALFKEKHPYELPQLVAWTGEGSVAYAAWLRSEVSYPTAP